ncbi:MAG: glycosyltransferase [Candidatus Krumholzibacteria bacterium]|nr:glycosyltransferase [Candidatus Krumholzibacteria bacterium]
MLRFFCPGQILVSSYRSLLLLSRFSLKGGVLPVGVDQRLFRKVGIGEKAELRKRFGIDQKAFVFLLADPVRDLDDLQPVSPLRDVAGSVIAARIGPDANARIHSSLRGVRIMPFEQSLPDLYGLSDCVVFYKTAQKERLEIPMSVIEALSCGVPVLAKPFGGLRDFLSAGDDVCYWSSRGELVRAAQRLRAISPVRVRSMKQFAWERVAARVTENTAM